MAIDRPAIAQADGRGSMRSYLKRLKRRRERRRAKRHPDCAPLYRHYWGYQL
jgi:hypothetical protein